MWALADLTLVFLLLRTKVGTPAAARLEEPGVTFLEELEDGGIDGGVGVRRLERPPDPEL